MNIIYVWPWQVVSGPRPADLHTPDRTILLPSLATRPEYGHLNIEQVDIGRRLLSGTGRPIGGYELQQSGYSPATARLVWFSPAMIDNSSLDWICKNLKIPSQSDWKSPLREAVQCSVQPG